MLLHIYIITYIQFVKADVLERQRVRFTRASLLAFFTFKGKYT